MADRNAQLVARALRDASPALLVSWEVAIRGDVPELAGLEAQELREHVEQIVLRCSDVLGGDSDRSATLRSVAEAHAVQRLRRGISVRAMLREYTCLRLCIHAALEPLTPVTEIDQLLDRAVEYAVAQYVSVREEQRERLIGMLAHDLRNPLSCVAMASELLLASKHWPTQRSMLVQIQEASQRMQRMVGDVLSFARGHLGGGLPIAPREHDLGHIVRRVVGEMRTIYGEATISAEVGLDLHGRFDPDRVHQLVGNLLCNAVEHGSGAAFVRVYAESDSYVLLVRNRGAVKEALSLPPEYTRRRRKTTPGHGLGLFIVDQIARAHGAHVELSAMSDETAVTVRWPKPSSLTTAPPP